MTEVFSSRLKWIFLGKPTIISTNIPLGVIMNGSNDIDKERIYSRIREMCIPVKIAGKDIRH